MKTLTVFTPTYNRKHTLPRTYESLCRQTCRDFDWLVIDDGSSDGTREWILSLGEMVQLSEVEASLVEEKLKMFDWMGRIISSLNANDRESGRKSDVNTFDHFFIQAPNIRIEYVYKPNGGLYTGYNVAYQTIQTELCVCIDSDDFMPDDAIEKALALWKKVKDVGADKTYCGIVGLDFDVRTQAPIGGFFEEGLEVAWAMTMKHTGDVKYVMRTDMMQKVAPQIGFKGERDFNPHYMQVQVQDLLPVLVLNDNLCWVEYQIGGDSMSQGIWKQYVRSPRSYAKYRINQMTLKHGNPLKNKFRLCMHYVSSCILSKDRDWLKNTPLKLMTIIAAPIGLVLTYYIKYKTRK